jgi:CheY-like chemotaxis protein
MSLPSASTITILMADDDAEDRELTRAALADARLPIELRFVVDGQELMDYLRRAGAYGGSGGEDAPEPDLILLDLNMPRMDGREALAEIKADRDLRQIPIIVMTVSRAEEDVFASYDLGVSSFITKPIVAAELVDVMRAWSRYWLEVVDLHPHGDRLGRAHG